MRTCIVPVSVKQENEVKSLLFLGIHQEKERVRGVLVTVVSRQTAINNSSDRITGQEGGLFGDEG